MKKIVFGLALLTIIVVFIACDNPSSSDSSRSPSGSPGEDFRLTLGSPPSAYAEEKPISESDTEYVFFPNNTVTVITTKSELGQYHISGHSNDGFREAIENYSEDFFEYNFLVIISFWEISGSITNEVEGVYANGDIVIERFEPELQNHALAIWNIVIQLENDNMQEEFSAVFIEKQ